MIEITRELSINNIEDVIFGNASVNVSQDDKQRIEHCYHFLREFSGDKVVYGINTGFGPMAQYRVDDKSLADLQYNIIRSHSIGAGKPLPALYVRAAMLARLGTFMQAKSGVHPELPALLAEFINKGIYPLIPEHGGVGASGDLVQLAHMGLALIGEGEVFHKGTLCDTAEVLRQEGVKPLTLHIREGLAVTNGTSVMTGIGLVNLIHAERLLNLAVTASVMMNEIASSYDDFMSATLNESKRHRGQREIARMMREIAAGSTRLRKRESELYNGENRNDKLFEHKVQPYYSLRCVPQILGPVYDTLGNALRLLTDELNSACDNPIVDPDTQNVYHGGNFHGDYISVEMDKVKISVTKMVMLAERQLNYLLHDRINGILPPFVNMGVLGLNYGMQAAQFTATSTTAECQTLSNPMSVHSIPNNNDNQDVVSMGTNSALITKTVVDNGFQVMAIHVMSLVQAVDCLKIADSLSSRTRALYDEIRGLFPAFADDKPKYKDVELIKNYLMDKKSVYRAML